MKDEGGKVAAAAPAAPAAPHSPQAPPAPRVTPAPLSYARPDPPPRISWLDLSGHAMFGLGLALLLGGFVGKDYPYGGNFGDFLNLYYPHLAMAGAFICGMLVSVRLGSFTR